ncbi:MAG: type II toxin-antitoxin system RelE/ParE family toxin [Acidobacteria bacterium]|nr:type II toxin-antitoxin system RelE/ParE family toxin [Acidobacteriota bacterium]
MSRQYSLTPAARADLVEIDSYLRRESPQAATQVRTKLRDAMRGLAERPGMGHLREDLADEPLRFWPVYSYLIIYRIEARPLQIVRVLHASRDVHKLLSCTG